MTNTYNLLCKGKRKDNGEWIEGYYCPKKAYCFDNRTPSSHVIITEFSSTGYVAKEIDINTLTPIESLEKLHELIIKAKEF